MQKLKQIQKQQKKQQPKRKPKQEPKLKPKQKRVLLEELPEDLRPLFNSHFELDCSFPIKGVIIGTLILILLFLIMKFLFFVTGTLLLTLYTPLYLMGIVMAISTARERYLIRQGYYKVYRQIGMVTRSPRAKANSQDFCFVDAHHKLVHKIDIPLELQFAGYCYDKLVVCYMVQINNGRYVLLKEETFS